MWRVRARWIIVSAVLAGKGLIGHETAAQDQPAAVRVDHSGVNANVGGLHVCIPEKWSVLDLVVSNPLDESREIMSATYFDGEPTLQYGRRIWVPPRARITTWLPVLLPKLPPGGAPQFTINSVVFDATQSREVLHREKMGGRLHSGIVPARVDRPVTGYMGPSATGRRPPDAAYELVIAGRLGLPNLSRRLALFDVQARIPDEFSLQGIDQLVISNERIHEDLVRLTAIRRWVHAGGVLWVMLDETDALALERIAGDDFRCSVVDRVELTTVRIESKTREGKTIAVESDHEQPVDLVRMVLDDGDIQVEHTVNGWPAAFWKPLGAGRLLVTTLGPRGWMRLRQPKDALNDGLRNERQRSREPGPQQQAPSSYVVLDPMTEISKSFFRVAAVPHSSLMEAFESQTEEYVGYSIPPRWQIAGILAGFSAAIVALGIWLRHMNALEHSGWTGPLLSIGAAALLLVIGGFNRHAIPATVAAVDFVQPISGTDDVRVRGTAAFYRPEAGPWEIASTHGGRLMPDMTGQDGTTRRLVWSDLDAWSWQNLAQMAPRRDARYDQAQTLATRVEARATFGPDGLIGRLSTPANANRVTANPGAANPGDAILATGNGQLGVALAADGAFRASADGVLGHDQYLAAGILSDEQNRRQGTNERVLQHLRRDDWSGPPLLMLWTDDRISAFQFGEERRLLGAALLAIPLVLERPAAGSAVRIPAPFLDYRSTTQPGGQPSSPLWDHAKQEWNEYSSAATVWLKFQLPRELLPLESTGGRLKIRVTGPVGRLEVFGLSREPGDDRTGTAGGQA
ncbi:MAG TPA: hypothetical protein VGH74_14490, partial [Planctomycetaceae bacterium]